MIPVMLVLVIAHGLLTNKLVDTSTVNLQQTAQTNINGLEALIKAKQSEVSFMSMQDELITALLQNNREVTYDRKNIDRALSNLLGYCADHERLTLYNIHNEVIACSDPLYTDTSADYQPSPEDLAKSNSPLISPDGIKPILIKNRLVYKFEICAPVTEPVTGNILGYVTSTINTSYINDFLESITIGETGFCFLLDNNGRYIYHPKTELIGTIIKSKKLSTLSADYMNNSIPASGTFTYFYENSNQAMSYSIIPGLNWVLIVKQDISEIKSLTTVLLALLTLVCCILLIITVISANTLAKKFSTPIIELRDAMRTAADGNLTVQSNIKSNNEIGELSKNFNKMLHIIKTNYEDLESMHDELLSNEEQLRSNYDHIEFLAYHDTLTNLPNKLAFLDYINAVLTSSPVKKIQHAVYFVDLDNFKTVNDTLGHEFGDTLLMKTAQILSSIIGTDGMLARAGGDEFLIFRENVETKEKAVAFASQIIEFFKNPLDLEGEIVYVSMSIGISIYPENGISSNSLIKYSDIAMYKSKDTGKNKYTLFDKKMEEELSRNTLIIEVLRNAIENKEIYVQYQPFMELRTNNVIGFEALMRIHNDRLGTITPDEFIPIAEESGLIIELSSWLLREVCRFNKNLIDIGAKPRPVAVNISSVQINRPGFVSLLSEVLKETSLPPQYLELEITESTLVSSIMDATKLLNDLQKLGVRISLDDFGTGYSSLNYLTKMPINTLKIDKSFIDNICNNRKDAFISESIIQLAHSLDIKVVAEGVENTEQLVLLREQKCDIIQGFIYSPPLHPSALLDIIREDDMIMQCSLF
jgi:diguanylate cyclase (GGDEF)-like protein